MFRQVESTIVFLALVTINKDLFVESTACGELITCLEDQGVTWSGSGTPDPLNINKVLYKSFYQFLCSNKAAYVNCEIYNRTLVKDCSELAGPSLIDGTAHNGSRRYMPRE